MELGRHVSKQKRQALVTVPSTLLRLLLILLHLVVTTLAVCTSLHRRLLVLVLLILLRLVVAPLLTACNIRTKQRHSCKRYTEQGIDRWRGRGYAD